MDRETKLFVGIGVSVVGVLLGIFLGFRLFEKIDNGYQGVRYSINGGVRNETLSQGVKFVGWDKVIQYPVRTQTVKAKKLNAATKDGKTTHVSITYSYKVDPTKVSAVFKEFGSAKVEDLEEGWIKSQLLKSTRKVISEYSILDVMGSKSTEVQNAILTDFQASADKKGFLVEDISLGVPDLDGDTKAAIDKQQVAQQEADRAKIEAEKLQTETESKAKAQITQANANAQAKEIEAKSIADANDKISNSITDPIIRNKEAEAREKHGWVTVQGGSALVDAK